MAAEFVDVEADNGTCRDQALDARSVLGLLGRVPGHLLCVSDGHGKMLYVTPSIEETLGYRPERFVVEERQLLHPDDLDAVIEAWREILEHPGAEVPLSFRLRHADGSWRMLDGLVINALDVPGINGVVWNARDITQRLEAEAEVAASEHRLRSVLEQTYDVFLVLDHELNISWANVRMSMATGWEIDDVRGTPVLDYVHPDDRDQAALDLAHALAGDPPDDPTLVRASRKQGGWVWVEVVGANLLEDEAVEGYVICLREVTNRQEAELARREAELQVRRNEERFRGLVQNAADAVLVLSPDETVLYTSPQSKVFGVPAEQLVDRSVLEHVHPDDVEATRATLDAVSRQPGATAVHTFRVLAGSGQWRWAEARVSNMLDNEAVAGIVANVADVTERVEAEKDAQRLLRIFEATDDLVCVTDPTGKVTHLNRSARELLLVDSEDEIPPLELAAFFASWELDRLEHELLPALRDSGSWSGELDILDPDGRHFPALVQLLAHRGMSGQLEYFSAVMRDISERKAFEDRLEHQATHDPLTGLPNRTLLLDRLTMALARARRHEAVVAVLFLDLDHFKVINDSRGHTLGDQLLAAIANRLATALRPDDTVARFGGDEFVVLCEDLHSENQAILVARRIQRVLGDVFSIGATEIFVGASIGISSFDGSADTGREATEEVTPEILLREADAAMYRVKERGRGEIAVFDETLRSRSLHRLDTETALRRALDRDELEVHYQPIVDLATGRVRHLEALVRWHHPDRGMLLPGEFVPIAEETGLIVPIGRFVLEKACQELARWRAGTGAPPEVNVSVNLSGRQLAHPDLVDDLEEIIESTGLPGHAIVLEMTESLLMEDVEFSHQTLARLKRLKVLLAVDDFGTGYSSLSYLRSFPVDVLKVDRSFVMGLGTEAGDEAIVTAIVRLAHSLGLEAVAEGVETAGQLARLRALGCNMAQGFYLARPAPAEQAFATLHRFGA